MKRMLSFERSKAQGLFTSVKLKTKTSPSLNQQLILRLKNGFIKYCN
jgi:hypothetical protein